MIDNFIFNPLSENTTNVEYLYFVIPDMADYIDNEGNGRQNTENQNTIAKTIIKDNNKLHYIKSSISHQLFNPFSKFDREKSYSFLDNVVKPTDKFILVNHKTFTYYLKFLITQNTSWLNKAERERV